MIDKAITNLRPGAQFTLLGDNYAGLNWLDTEQGKPSETEVMQEVLRLQALPPSYTVRKLVVVDRILATGGVLMATLEAMLDASMSFRRRWEALDVVWSDSDDIRQPLAYAISEAGLPASTLDDILAPEEA